MVGDGQTTQADRVCGDDNLRGRAATIGVGSVNVEVVALYSRGRVEPGHGRI